MSRYGGRDEKCNRKSRANPPIRYCVYGVPSSPAFRNASITALIAARA